MMGVQGSLIDQASLDEREVVQGLEVKILVVRQNEDYVRFGGSLLVCGE